LIADVIAGKVHPTVAAGLAVLMSLQLHAIKTADGFRWVKPSMAASHRQAMRAVRENCPAQSAHDRPEITIQW
jgi:hypothetical protein